MLIPNSFFLCDFFLFLFPPIKTVDRQTAVDGQTVVDGRTAVDGQAVGRRTDG